MKNFTFGKESNTADIGFYYDLDFTGDLKAYGGTITATNNTFTHNSASNNQFLLKAAGRIIGTNSTIQATGTGKLDTILWAESDGGNTLGVSLQGNSEITTNGGNLWIGGGSGTTLWNGLTVGDGYAGGGGANWNGIDLDGDYNTTDVTNGDGDIYVAGSTLISNDANAGVVLGFTQATNITTGTGDVTITSQQAILGTNVITINTTGGDVLFASDTDQATDPGGRIETRNGLTINTVGGDITFGGGNVLGTGYALGEQNATAEGLRFDNGLALDSGGGDIVLRGKSYAGATDSGWGAWGVSGWSGTQDINSGTGTILIDGISQSSGAGTLNMGVEFNGVSTTIQSANTTANAIKILGDASSLATGTTYGIGLEANTTNIYATGVGGGITLDGYSGTGNNADLAITGNTSILANSGPISLLGKHAGGLMYVSGDLWLGSKASTPVTTSSSDLLLEFDEYSFSSTEVSSTGDFTLSSLSDSMSQAFDDSNFIWNSQVGQTLGDVTLGKTTNTEGIIIGSALSAAGNISIYGGYLDINADISATGGNILLDALTPIKPLAAFPLLPISVISPDVVVVMIGVCGLTQQQ